MKSRKLVSSTLPAVACWFALQLAATAHLTYAAQITASADQQALQTVSPRNLDVIDLNSIATADEAAKARTAFLNGGAVVRMLGGSPADFERLVGARLADFNAFSQQGQTRGTGPKKQLKLQGVAAYRDSQGILRTLLSFAPNQENARKQIDKWVTSSQSKAAGALLGDPEPPSSAWTLLYTTTVVGSDGYGYAQSTDAVYRLNTTSTANDFYMVYTVPETVPNYDNFIGAASTCDGISFCASHTVERDFSVGLNVANGSASLVDHGPTGTITGSSVGFSIGASVGPDGPGVNAGFSASWDQPSVSTVDESNGQTAQWKETFQFSGDRCLPVVGTIPGVSSGTFLSRQGAIFQVPGGQTSFSTAITQQTLYCQYIGPLWDYNGNNGTGPYYDWLTLQGNFVLGNPVLQPRPSKLTVPAGGTQPLGVTAYIPNSDQGIPWQISSNQLWLTVPTSACISGGQLVPVSAAAGTPDGTHGTLSINTCTGFAAPSVTNGPILVNVTVGTPPVSPPAGILFFGGNGTYPAEYYDLATQISVPVTPNQPRPLQSSSTLLNTGNILVVGGLTQAPSFPPPTPILVTATAELFNPNSLTFSNTGSMATARAGHTATLLPNGKVLIVGGVDDNSNPLTSAELYDPVAGTFSSAGNLQTARTYHSATLLTAPGAPTQVIVYGGYTDNAQSVLDAGYEVWDESKNAFISAASMIYAVAGIPQPVATSDGLFLLVGGWTGGAQPTNQEQVLDFQNFGPSWGPSWGQGADLNVARAVHTLTALPNGAGFLVTGGFGAGGDRLSTAEFSTDPTLNGSWTLLSGTSTCPGSPGCMTTGRYDHTATLLPDGTVLLAGGNASGPNTEFYNPATKTFTAGPPIKPRASHTATLVVATATSLIATPSPSKFGESVKLAASVTSRFGTPTGTVQFMDGSTSLGSVQLIQGQASTSVSKFAIGSHTLSAVYAGDGVSGGSVSPVVTQVVAGSATTTSLSISPNPSPVGSAVIISASVAGADGPVTGTVVFTDSGKQIGSAPLSNGAAQVKINTLSVGQHPVAATYGASGNWQGSTSTTIVVTITPVMVNTTTTVSSSMNPSTTGQQVTFQAQVTQASGTATPTGTVNFLDGGTLLASKTLAGGTASFPTSALTAGTHMIVAAYQGQNNFNTSSSAPYTQTVSSSPGGKVTPVVSLTVNGSGSASVSPGAQVTFLARIHAASGYPVPNGSITISDSTNADNRYGSAIVTKDPNSNDGLATVVNNGISVGSYHLVATYGGDNQGLYYNGAQSNSVSLTVNGVGGPPPQPRLTIHVARGARHGTVLPVSLTLTNSSRGSIGGAIVNQVVLRTLAGSGKATLASSLPLVMGAVAAGQSTVFHLQLNVPLTVRKLAVDEDGFVQDPRGANYKFSLGQVIYP